MYKRFVQAIDEYMYNVQLYMCNTTTTVMEKERLAAKEGRKEEILLRKEGRKELGTGLVKKRSQRPDKEGRCSSQTHALNFLRADNELRHMWRNQSVCNG